MYTILVNESNELITSVKERIMQRSKLVDSLHFLVDPTYKNIDMSDFSVVMEYIMPISREYKTEMLVKSDELYKGKLEYKLPFDTCLTKEHGKIEIQLTFTKVELTPDGDSKQYVRKTSPTTITIVPISAWSDIIPDGALSALDQRMLKLDAQMVAVESYVEYIGSTQVDDLVYNDKDETLQLTANGVGVGNKVSVRDMLDEGIPVVDLGGSGNESDNGQDNNCDCGCDHEDNVVEFEDIVAPDQSKDDDNVVEF